MEYSVKASLAVFVFMLCIVTACDETVIITDDHDLQQIVPLPQPEIPEDPVDEYDEQAILGHVKSDFSWWNGVRPRKRQELSFERGTRKQGITV